MKIVNGRLMPETSDFPQFGESAGLVSLLDRVEESTDLFSSTEDSDDIACDDIAASGTVTITEANASALTVGANGATNPVLKINSATASVATGIGITGAAAAGGLAVAVISSGTNEALTLDAKGTGSITIAGTSTGDVLFGDATNPTFKVDHNATDAATGLAVTAAAAASGVALAVLSSGTNENLTIDAKGSGTITLGATSTGAVAISRATGITGNATVTSANASALAVGANGATNPVLKVDSSTASVATGLSITGAAAAGGLAVAVVSSGTNEALTLDARGSGAITIAGTSTGDVKFGDATNPAFKVDHDTASAATGLAITAAAAGAGVALAVISSGTNDNLTIDAKGSGTITLNATGTGDITLSRDTNIADAKNLEFATGTGTKIGSATNQKLGFWNATPVTQPTHNADPTACASMTGTALTSVGTTSSSPFGASTAAQFNRIVTAVDALITDAAALKTAIDANNAAIDAINADCATVGLTAAS